MKKKVVFVIFLVLTLVGTYSNKEDNLNNTVFNVTEECSRTQNLINEENWQYRYVGECNCHVNYERNRTKNFNFSNLVVSTGGSTRHGSLYLTTHYFRDYTLNNRYSYNGRLIEPQVISTEVIGRTLNPIRQAGSSIGWGNANGSFRVNYVDIIVNWNGVGHGHFIRVHYTLDPNFWTTNLRQYFNIEVLISYEVREQGHPQGVSKIERLSTDFVRFNYFTNENYFLFRTRHTVGNRMIRTEELFERFNERYRITSLCARKSQPNQAVGTIGWLPSGQGIPADRPSINRVSYSVSSLGLLEKNIVVAEVIGTPIVSNRLNNVRGKDMTVEKVSETAILLNKQSKSFDILAENEFLSFLRNNSFFVNSETGQSKGVNRIRIRNYIRTKNNVSTGLNNIVIGDKGVVFYTLQIAIETGAEGVYRPTNLITVYVEVREVQNNSMFLNNMGISLKLELGKFILQYQLEKKLLNVLKENLSSGNWNVYFHNLKDINGKDNAHRIYEIKTTVKDNITQVENLIFIELSIGDPPIVIPEEPTMEIETRNVQLPNWFENIINWIRALF